jgi:hypothetical protein
MGRLVVDEAGCAALDALLEEAWGVMEGRGSPALLVMLRLRRNRPEDAAARSFLGLPAGPRGG